MVKTAIEAKRKYEREKKRRHRAARSLERKREETKKRSARKRKQRDKTDDNEAERDRRGKREAERVRRNNMSSEEKEKKKRANRDAMRALRSQRSPEEIKKENEAKRDKMSVLRGERSEKENEELNNAKREAMREARKNRSADKANAQRETKRICMQLSREKERKERRKYAIDFSTLLSEYPHYPAHPTFDNAHRCLEGTVMKYYVTSGNMDFYRLKELDDPNDTKEEKNKKISGLKDEIRAQLPTIEKLENMRIAYATDTGIALQSPDGDISYTRILGCGCCGISDLESQVQFHKTNIRKLGLLKVAKDCKFLRLKDDRSRRFVEVLDDPLGNKKTIDLMRGINWWLHEETDQLYWLHPNLVDKEGNDKHYTYLCNYCRASISKKRIPEHSLAKVNFGSATRLNLPPLKPLTRLLLSRVRCYRIVLKLVPNDIGRTDGSGSPLRGHYIMFGHDTPKVLADVISSPDTLTDDFTLHLVCPKGRADWMMQQAFSTSLIQISCIEAHQWLTVLKSLNPEYEHDKVPSYDKLLETATAITDKLKKQAVIEECDKAVEAEMKIGDDVAGVRSSSLDEDLRWQAVASGDDKYPDPIVGSYSVHNLEGSKHGDNKRQKVESYVLRAIAKNLTANKKENCIRQLLRSKRQAEPLNEFIEGDRILVKAFPDVFLLGTAYGRTQGTLGDRQCRHLLCQHDQVPACCTELISFLTDQKIRHGNLGAVKRSMEASAEYVHKLAEKFRSKTYVRKALKAASQLKCKEAKEILDDFMPFLESSGRNIQFGVFDGKKLLQHHYALSMRYGSASLFGTIAPHDPLDPTAFRLALGLAHGNTQFPSRAGKDFYEALHNEADLLVDELIKIPCFYRKRYAVVSQNPVVSARMYKLILEAVVKLRSD